MKRRIKPQQNLNFERTKSTRKSGKRIRCAHRAKYHLQWLTFWRYAIQIIRSFHAPVIFHKHTTEWWSLCPIWPLVLELRTLELKKDRINWTLITQIFLFLPILLQASREALRKEDRAMKRQFFLQKPQTVYYALGSSKRK